METTKHIVDEEEIKIGYYTIYNLTIKHANADEEDKIREMLNGLNVIDYALDDNFNGYEPVTWYDHSVDMLKVSNAFPKVHFILSGEGENNGDVWEQHFIDGKTARYDAVITIPPLNPDDLR